MQGIFTLRDDVKLEDFAAVIDPFRKNIVKGFPAMHAVLWAVNSSDDRQVCLFVGWDSIEVSRLRFQISVHRTD
jgi:hypothetical protein